MIIRIRIGTVERSPFQSNWADTILQFYIDRNVIIGIIFIDVDSSKFNRSLLFGF